MDEVLKHKAASCWERYGTSADKDAMDALAGEFLDFLTRCKTERETIAWVAEQAAARGFSDDLHQDLVILPFRCGPDHRRAGVLSPCARLARLSAESFFLWAF